MTKKKNNKRAMLESVVSLLETNAARTSSIPGISESVDKFKDLIEGIRNKTVEVGQATAGKAAAKKQVREKLTVATLQVSGALHALACKTGDHELKAKTKMNESSLAKMRDTEVLSAAGSILNLAKSNAEGLAAQGFGQGVISVFEGTVQEYQTALGASLGAIPNRVATREMVGKLMADASDVLGNEVDRYLEFFRQEYPEFYSAYFRARRIRQFGVRHEQPELQVVAPDEPEARKAA